MTGANIEALAKAFPPAEFYLPPPEAITAEARREQRGHFNIIHLATGFKADFYLTGQDELNAWAFRSRRQFQFEGEIVMLAPPEYVIVRKLEYYREGSSEKHLRDIRSMLACRVTNWSGRHSTSGFSVAGCKRSGVWLPQTQAGADGERP